jgi:hypothetical protein
MGLIQTATQVNVAASGTTAPSIVLTSAVAGNTILAFASIWEGSTTWTYTNTTDGGNTFTSLAATATKPAVEQTRAIASVAFNITGGSRTVAFNLSGVTSVYYVLGCLEWSALASVDVSAATSDIDTTTLDISAGTITTTDAGDVLIGVAALDSFDATINFASPTSWTNSYRQNDSSVYIGMDAGYWVPGSIKTTYTAQWAHDNNAGDWGGGVVMALKPAAGGGPTVQAVPTMRTPNIFIT